MKTTCRCGLLIFVAISSLWAQAVPQVAELIDRARNSVSATQSIEFTIEVSWVSQVVSATLNTSALFQSKDGKFHVQINGSGAPVIFVMDGQNLWTVLPASKKYIKAAPRDAATYLRPLVNNPAGPGMSSGMADLPGATLVRSEMLSVDGTSRDCWVTESAPADFTVGRDVRGAVETIWYDKSLGMVLSRKVAGRVSMPRSDAFTPLEMKMTVHGLKVNPTLDDSLFIFNPPADATEMHPAPSPAPMASTGKGRLSPGALRKQVSPVYPAAAKSARAEGTVRLSAIIGKDGAVRELKVLSGHPLLIEAAMDAVKQWVYTPAMLDGNPVESLTTIDVNFSLPPSGPPTK